ncbi:MAG: efflux transporter, family, subunit, partial [Frankiales bacterium]|nr:efflux transporter, family, subunit [Frankiales bacterium]
APIAGVVTLGAGAPTSGGADLSGLLGSLPAALQGAAGAALGGGGSAPAASTTTNDLSPGAPVGSGTPLLTVTDLSSFGVAAEVDETDVQQVEAGTAADVELDAVPGTTYRATVTGVDLAPTTSTRGGVSYRVRLSLTSPTPAPRPGMSAVVRLKVREATGVLSVPAAAVVRDGADDVVFVVRGGRAVRRVVTTGAEGEDAVEVTEGLREGERIVTRDADTLSDGEKLDL